MNRPTREETLMAIADAIALRGTCDRKQVGAVIARQGRIISVGYNGAPPGLPHCDANHHGWPETEWPSWDKKNLEEHGCRNATHAEANALAFAAKYGVPTDHAELFVTVAPCENCARLLIAAGISRVIFRQAYRIDRGLDLLKQGLIPISQLLA